MNCSPNIARNEEIVAAREVAKMTYRQIGDLYGISAERVRQICNRAVRRRKGLPR